MHDRDAQPPGGASDDVHDSTHDRLDDALAALLLPYAEASPESTLRSAVAAFALTAWQRGVPLQVITRELRERFNALPMPRARHLHALQRERLVTLVVSAYSRGGTLPPRRLPRS